MQEEEGALRCARMQVHRGRRHACCAEASSSSSSLPLSASAPMAPISTSQRVTSPSWRSEQSSARVSSAHAAHYLCMRIHCAVQLSRTEARVSPITEPISPIEALVSPIEALISPVKALISHIKARVSPIESVLWESFPKPNAASASPAASPLPPAQRRAQQ